MGIFFGYVSIELLIVYRSLFILQRRNDMHEELMGVMLHRGVKFLTNQVLKACRVQDLLVL